MELRPYQRESIEAIFNQWQEGNRKTLLVLPTGCGKTVVFAKVAEECVRRGERVLVLAHRQELLDQAQKKIKSVTGLESALEMAEHRAIDSWSRVVVASIQTLQQEKRLKQFEPDYFDTIIVDEAHHILAESYLKVVNYFESAKILGVTATADRADKKYLGQFFDTLAYEYNLKQAIDEHFLSPIQTQLIPINIDFKNVKVSHGDYALADIGHTLEPYLEQIAEECVTFCKGRKTVVFLPLIDISQKFCSMLNERGMIAEEVNGQSQDRKEILERFEHGNTEVLCNSMLLTEGWDCPAVDCIIVLRPTKSRALYVQMVGRGTRLHPGKDHLLILDFLWHTDKHKLIKPIDLVAPSEEASKKGAGMSGDLFAIIEQVERDILAERSEKLREELEKQRHQKRKLVDPLQYELSIQCEDLSSYVPSFGWEAERPTDNQVTFLNNAGLFVDPTLTRGKAVKLIDTLVTRNKLGLSTPKQIRLLERIGFVNVGTWSKEEASSMIGRLANNNWRVPRGLNPTEYIPKGGKTA